MEPQEKNNSKTEPFAQEVPIRTSDAGQPSMARVYGGAVMGIDAIIITVEVTILNGIKIFVVGLPDNAVKEAIHRIESALVHCGFRMPRRKTVINLSPADIRKEGSSYDLTMALGILAASGQLPSEQLGRYLIMGELSLDGTLQPITGALPIAIQAQKEQFEGCILPRANVREAAIVDNLKIYAADHLNQVVAFFSGRGQLEQVRVDINEEFARLQEHQEFDFAEVRGQENIKRAMEIAAAGGHNLILIGPPGAGKTMLARRLPSILPPLSLQEALETTKIHSVAGKLPHHATLLSTRPFRAPHHTISDVALVGGGAHPQPGEISLAHNGVLFLDELPEFKRTVLEVLRQPMEERRVTISRAKFSVEYPASFMLVAAMNPCPCGFFNHPTKECVCPPGAVQKYLNRISGPLLDRIDLHVEVTPVTYDELTTRGPAEKSASIRQRVVQARHIQQQRFADLPGLYCNAQITSRLMKTYCRIPAEGDALIKSAMEKLGLSARAYDRILKVARTIADLDGAPHIQLPHLAEAIQYRSLDRDMWAA